VYIKNIFVHYVTNTNTQKLINFLLQKYRHGAVNCLLNALCDVHDDTDSESAPRINDRQRDRQTDRCILQ